MSELASMPSSSNMSDRDQRASAWELNSGKDTDSFRAAMRRVISGVTVITTHHQDRPWGMTVSAFTPVCMEHQDGIRHFAERRLFRQPFKPSSTVPFTALLQYRAGQVPRRPHCPRGRATCCSKGACTAEFHCHLRLQSHRHSLDRKPPGGDRSD